ncbi:MAG: Gp15 family bacteriophage protein [Oscillospiraceae bacterium]|nr:Gp15 family bacteriophage protein [Oscillospiraceae bacterium]
MMCELPTALEIDGIEHPIQSDYRAALDICAALSDNEFTSGEKALALLEILYEDAESISNYEEAIRKALWFISCGDDSTPQRKRPKLVDWEQDFSYIVAPINKAAGCEIRALPYMHWWTFISFYYEIGECTFSNIVNIRNKKAKGKKLEKWEQEFYRENRGMIDFKSSGMTDDEKSLIKDFIGG